MIVPTARVSRYLSAKKKEGFQNFELIVFEGTHGEVTVLPKWLRFVAKKVRERYCVSEIGDKSAVAVNKVNREQRKHTLDGVIEKNTNDDEIEEKDQILNYTMIPE